MIRFMLLVTCLGLWCWGCAGVNKQVESKKIQEQALVNVQAIASETPTTIEHYIVEFGDCLWTISALKYHDPFMWPLIFKANRDQISDPDIIEVGQNLVIERGDDDATVSLARLSASNYPPYHRKHRHKK
jgi:hypothetical protein